MHNSSSICSQALLTLKNQLSFRLTQLCFGEEKKKENIKLSYLFLSHAITAVGNKGHTAGFLLILLATSDIRIRIWETYI